MAAMAPSPAVRLDPGRTLVFVGGRAAPMGSIGTWGFGDTSYHRAMNDPRSLADLAVGEGLLRRLEDGRYADARTSEGVSPDEVETLYRRRQGDRPGLEDLAGPRLIPADHPTLTRHGGLLPESVRRDVAAYMGISPKDKMAGRAPLGMQIQALVGARYLAGLGATLPELFPDPQKLSVVASSALPGTEKFVESARATGVRLDDKLVTALGRLRALADEESVRHFAESEAETLRLVDEFLRDPVAGRESVLARRGVLSDTMRISHILGSGVATVFANMIGPRSNKPNEDPLLGARTLGPEFHHTGECATFFGSVRAAALMLRADPDEFQVPDMVLVGAAEAGFAVPAARILQFLFDSMGAMEQTDKVFARGADLWTGYAPLSTDVGGFWPGEAAGMVGLTTAEFARKHRLRILAELVSLGASADQGGKDHPAALGLGGYNSLQHALKVAGRKGIIPTYANVHGTGTKNNNKEEPGSLKAILRAGGFSGMMHLFADKAVSTHGLGAAGALALSGMLYGIVHGALPGAANLTGRTVDPTIDPNLFVVSPDPVRDFLAILLRSQGFWGNNEDLVIQAVREGYLASRFEGVDDGEESKYWAGVRERDDRGAENIARVSSKRQSYLDLLERVRLQ